MTQINLLFHVQSYMKMCRKHFPSKQYTFSIKQPKKQINPPGWLGWIKNDVLVNSCWCHFDLILILENRNRTPPILCPVHRAPPPISTSSITNPMVWNCSSSLWFFHLPLIRSTGVGYTVDDRPQDASWSQHLCQAHVHLGDHVRLLCTVESLLTSTWLMYFFPYLHKTNST